MKIKVDSGLLKIALAQAVRASDARSAMAVLSNLMLVAQGADLEIVSTDLELGMVTRIPVLVEAEGCLLVPAARFRALVNAAPVAAAVEVCSAESEVLVKIGTGRYRLPTLPPEEFPALAKGEGIEVRKINGQYWAEALAAVAPAMATDEGRYNLAGVYLDPREDRLEVVATDGNRLNIVERDNDIQLEPVGQIGTIIPRKAVAVLGALLPDQDEVRAGRGAPGQGGNTILFEMVRRGQDDRPRISTALIVRLLEARYPDFRQVIPTGDLKTVELSRTDLQEALKRITPLIGNSDYRKVVLSFNGACVIEYSNPDHGSARQEIAASDCPEEMTVALNVNYLLDLLKTMTSERITIGQADAVRPVRFTGPADEGFTGVIMPMQI